MRKCQKSKIFEHVGKKRSFFQTKAQGLPLNIIIIAIIALIVLGIVVFIFYDQIKKVATGFKETREKSQICQTGWIGGQKCVTPTEETEDGCPTGWQYISARCEGEDEICCERKPKTGETKK